MKQQTMSDMEYGCRKKKTKREVFLEIMDEIIPWDEWVGVIRPYYPKGEHGHPPIDLELILRMYLLQCWFNLSDPGTEDTIYDSCAMRKFTGIDFMSITSARKDRKSESGGRDWRCERDAVAISA